LTQGLINAIILHEFSVYYAKPKSKDHKMFKIYAQENEALIGTTTTYAEARTLELSLNCCSYIVQFNKKTKRAMNHYFGGHKL
jgi:hypothetical protein